MIKIILPELGEGITKATVACWHAQPGEHVKQGQDLCELVTDKAVFVIEAPVDGTLQSIVVSQGQEGAVGTVLGLIE